MTIAPAMAALVLLAALLHATWNGLLRGSDDRLWSMNVISLSSSGIALVALPFIAPLTLKGWAYAAASGIVHIFYNLSLARSYKAGDLGEIYPIARGSSPLLVAAGAFVFAGERLTFLAVLGVGLISGGIFLLAFRRTRIEGQSLGAALLTGVCIAIYSIIDGLGVRETGDAIAYTASMSSVSLLMPIGFVALWGPQALARPARDWIYGIAGGALSLIAYAIVIFAMRTSAMSIVSALRETSVVFAALIGWLFLHETLTVRRLAACCIIALGAANLAVARHPEAEASLPERHMSASDSL